MIPDQSHINRLRDELWKRPGAGISVMVGSGFSRSAEKIRFDADDIPMWWEIATEMHRSLDPEGVNNYQQGATAPTLTGDSALRLGEEYRTEFGRSKLHELLEKLVRDHEFAPGEAHLRLLSLPWRDVYTTNWDTLLERASLRIAVIAYSVVQDMGQLPLMSQPRIVKLHGSLPAHFPLIFTEEDYRTYPIKFAPYVNTVQQAMMESLFLLIGFSGDDPNFLNWSGWVRDNLGEAAPKIYLAGWLGLSRHRRRMLEDRGVIAIDLAEHPRAQEWPDHKRHQFATEWLLHSLEMGKPYDQTTWPSPQSREISSVPEYLQPVVRIVENVPKCQPEKERRTNSPNYENEPLERVKEVLDAWAHNRRLYPGWLIFPFGQAHYDLSFRTREWELPILDLLPQFQPVERLKAIRELIWRYEILLEPISVEIETSASKVLESINSIERSIEGVCETRDDWPDIRDAWRMVALALVTDARYECKQALFEHRLKALIPLSREDPDSAHRMQQERCLWAAYSLDFDQLNRQLEDWDVENCDPAWMLRKAALLTEAQRFDKSSGLIQKALNTLRLNVPRGKSIAVASRESWAIACKITRENQLEVQRDWDRFASQRCDASAEIEHITRTLQGIEQQKQAPSFDFVLRESSRIEFSNAGHARMIAAYRAIRLPEVTGLPLFINPSGDDIITFQMASGFLALAADALVKTNPELAVRLVLRICRSDGDEGLQRVLSRTRIAVLSDHSVETLAATCMGAIEYALPLLSTTSGYGGGISWFERMRVALEVLSRLAPRLQSEMVEAALSVALKCYETREVALHLWLGPPLEDLLKRSWMALSREQRTKRVLELLTAPIVGFEGFEGSAKCPDPGVLVSSEDFLLFHTPATNSECRNAIDFLKRGLEGSKIAQSRVALRLMPLVESDSLTNQEWSDVSSALWNNSDPIAANSLGGVSPLDWVYLILPEPVQGMAERSFREKWITPNQDPQSEEPTSSIDSITQVGAAINGLEAQERRLYLSIEDQQYIVAHIERIVEKYSSNTGEFSFGIGTTIRYIGPLAAKVQIPSAIAERLVQEVEKLLSAESEPMGRLSDFLANDRIAVAFALVPGLIRALPEYMESLSRWLSIGLGSEETRRARGAMSAMQTWLIGSARSEMVPVPNDLIRDVGAIIASGRRLALAGALVFARLVFEKGSPMQIDTIGPPALRGLHNLAEELKYESNQDGDADVHTLRLLCTELAICMVKQGIENDATVAEWLAIGKEDPFSEIRNEVFQSGLEHRD